MDTIVYFLGNARAGEFEALRRGNRGVGLIRDVSSHGLCAPDDMFDDVLAWDPAEGLGAVIADLRERAAGDRFAGVLNLREAYVEAYAKLLADLGRGGMSEQMVGGLRSKAVMRSAFRDTIGADATGRHGPADRVEDVLAFGDRHGWPVIVKPEALYSSLFVTTVSGPDEVESSYEAMRQGIVRHVHGKGLPARYERLQVEEFMVGSNHSVDCVVDASGVPTPGPVVDVLTGHDFGGSDFSHFARFAPSRVPAESRAAMRRLACAAVRALMLRRCAAHVEFILTPDGPRLLEAAVRPGGHRIRVLDRSHGVNFAEAYLAAVNGEPHHLDERRRDPFAIITPFPHRDGIFAGIHGIDRVEALPSYRGHSVHAEPGTPIGLATSGFWQVMAIELAHERADQIGADTATIWAMSDLVGVR